MFPGSAAGDPGRTLVEKIQAGIDYEHSCEELYSLFQRRVHGFFASRGFSADERLELTQLTFIRVFQGIGDFHFGSRFERWLFEIAANTYRNELRRRGAAKRDALEEPIDAIRDLSSEAPDPERGALDRERLEGLRREIEKLPPQMRRCLLLRNQGHKYREVAALMKISIETVKAHLHQAQIRLKLALSDWPDDPGTEGDS
jgi:RNA polymerase sigma factor (sigma-70 family)